MNNQDYKAIAEIINESMMDRSNVYFWSLYIDLIGYFEKNDPNFGKFQRDYFFKKCYQKFLREDDNLKALTDKELEYKNEKKI
jgi:hypothetical protein